jgi:hypothetical protein
VDDFFENGSHDLRTAGRVATIYFHKASLRSRGWCRRLWDRYSSLISIGHDSVKQVGEAQGKQINRLVHHVLAPKALSPGVIIGRHGRGFRGYNGLIRVSLTIK